MAVCVRCSAQASPAINGVVMSGHAKPFDCQLAPRRTYPPNRDIRRFAARLNEALGGDVKVSN